MNNRKYRYGNRRLNFFKVGVMFVAATKLNILYDALNHCQRKPYRSTWSNKTYDEKSKTGKEHFSQEDPEGQFPPWTVKIIGSSLFCFLALKRLRVGVGDFQDNVRLAALRYSEHISPKIIG